jgi:hypothetical protein
MSVFNVDPVIKALGAKLNEKFMGYCDAVLNRTEACEINIHMLQEMWGEFYIEARSILQKEANWAVFCVMDDKPLLLAKIKEYELKGVKLHKKKKEKKEIYTTMGKMHLARSVLYPKTPEDRAKLLELEGIKSVVPLDLLLEIDGMPFRASREFAVEAARIAVSSKSFAEGAKLIKKLYGDGLSAESLREMTAVVGRKLFEHETSRASEMYLRKDSLPMQRNVDGTLYFFYDGAFVPMRAETGEVSHTDCKLAICVKSTDIEPYVDKRGEPQARVRHKDHAAFIGSSDDFLKYGYALAVDNGYGRFKQIVVLGDGAPYIDTFSSVALGGAGVFNPSDMPYVVRITDWYHVEENMGKFANAVIPGKSESKAFIDDVLGDLYDGRKREAMSKLEKYKGAETPLGVSNMHEYLSKRINTIDYAEYRRAGWMIGSGIIESGNKAVTLGRLRLTGMSWGKDSAQFVATLRAALFSDKFDLVLEVFLNCNLEDEVLRNRKKRKEAKDKRSAKAAKEVAHIEKANG